MDKGVIRKKNKNIFADYCKAAACGTLTDVAGELFVESVKQGEIEVAKLVLPHIDIIRKDSVHILYEGRYYSQLNENELFIAFFQKYEKILKNDTSLHEGLLPWIWRMGISQAKKSELSSSEFYFDMHKDVAAISKHEMAHYFQCFGAVLIMCGNIKKGNVYLSEALETYFKEFDREESHHSIIDNIRCIIMNLLLQGIMDLQVGDYDIAYKKFTFCKLWFAQTQIKMQASGISEIATLLNLKYPKIIKYIFNNEAYAEIQQDVLGAISDIYDNYEQMLVYDIHFILRACIELNKPMKKIKYFYVEELKMQSKKVFVVEGRNKKMNEAMFTFLTAVGLEPIEWEQARALTGRATPYIGEIIEKAFLKAQAIIVLLTSDEECKLKKTLQTEKNDHVLRHQPRANVIFEAGAAFAYNPERTILIKIGDVSLWSDIEGRHVVHMDNSPEKRHTLVGRLKTAGCEIDVEGKSKWLAAGNFEDE